MKRLIFLTLCALSGPAMALEPNDVQKCWNIMPTQIGIGAEVEIDIVLAADGSVSKAEITRYSPDNDLGYDLARGAYRAVIACSPYVDSEAGPVSLRLVVDEQEAPASIPLPGSQ
jgi:hypothetical protein